MITYCLPRRLTGPAWEDTFGPGCGLFDEAGHWTGQVIDEGLRLDLSRVEFADFAALARALLLLDAAMRSGVPASIVLPTAELSAAAQAHLTRRADAATPNLELLRARLNRRARMRGDARAFMRQLGFEDALSPGHWPPGAVSIENAGGGQTARPAGATDGEYPHVPPVGSEDHPYRRRRLLPFRWLRTTDDQQVRGELLPDLVAALHDIGLSRSDAQALVQELVAELVHNITAHAAIDGRQPPPALVGGVLLDPDVYAARGADRSDRVRELIDCATSTTSKVLQLVVGDSGTGLAAQLSARENTGPAAAVHPFDRWQHEVHGLWRVARLVRTYRGRVEIRSGEASVGKLFGRQPMGTDVVRSGLGHWPGTLVEVDVLTDPRIPQELAGSWPSEHDDISMAVVDCTVDPHDGLTDSDQGVLAGTARRAEQAGTVTGLIVTVTRPDNPRPTAEPAVQAVLRRVLESQIANPLAVIVVFPDIPPRILEVGIAGLHEQDGDTSTADYVGERNIVLALGSHGPAHWCGGSTPLRRILGELTEANGSLDRTETLQLWMATGGDPVAFWRVLRDQPNILAEDGRRILLRISPDDVVRSLLARVSRQIVTAVSDGCPGVALGAFRTPTLRLTSRWIDVHRLVDHTVGPTVAAFLLARMVEQELRRSAEALPVAMVQTATMPDQLASQLSECLSLSGLSYAAAGDLDLDVQPNDDQVPADARVILCADLLSTENTARRAISAVVRTKAVPVVIACVVDARPRRGPIEIFNRRIPVIALSEVDIGVPADPSLPVVDIDPMLRQPVAIGPKTPVTLAFSPATLLEWCAADRTILRLGHIKRPRRMHFSAHLRLDRLLANQEIADLVIAAISGRIAETLAGWTVDGPSDMQIWYPSDSAYAGMLATMLTGKLTTAGHSIRHTRMVPRGVAGDRWAFPASLGSAGTGGPVIILDWGVVSAASIQQMIRLAAGAGASSIIVIAVLSQIADHDAEVLVAYRAVGGPVPQNSNGSSAAARIVPTAVHLITAISITGMPAHDCGICATRERYTVDPAATPPRLAQHAERLREMLRPKTREEVVQTGAMDLFNVPISGRDIADYLRWRGLLQRALRSTADCQEVVRRLAVLGTEPETAQWCGDNLIRLVAAEQQWLKLPPLRFAEGRELLAEACTANLASPTRSVWLRIQALIVLTSAYPERFVQQVADLVVQVANEPVLIDQLLLDCHRLLHRASPDSPADIAQLRDGLQHCRDHLEQHPIGDNPALAMDYHRVLSELIITARYQEQPRPPNAQTAWARLREDLWRRVVTHRLDGELWLVRSFVDRLQGQQAVLDDMDPRHSWQTCTNHLIETALVNLPPLREILAGEYVEDRIGQANQRRLFQLTEPDGISQLRVVGGQLDRLIREPWTPDDPQWRTLRRDMLDQLDWWNEMFFAAHLPDSDLPARFVDLINSAPTMLGERIDQVLRNRGIEATVAHSEIGAAAEVFCPKKLIDDVVGHLLDNAERHGLPDVRRRFHVDYRRGDRRTVQFVLRNTGSRRRSTPGRGLRSCNDKLTPFGASVNGDTIADGDWTFEAAVTLSLWRGE